MAIMVTLRIHHHQACREAMYDAFDEIDSFLVCYPFCHKEFLIWTLLILQLEQR